MARMVISGNRRFGRPTGVAVLAFLSAVSATRAPADDATDEKARIERLEQTLDRIERRLELLEHADKSSSPVPTTVPETQAAPEMGRPAPAAPQSATAPPPIQSLRENRRAIRRRMAEDDVTRLLGAPTRLLQIDSKHVWYYEYPGVGSGSVAFDSNSRVDDWQHPPLGLWGLW